MGLISYRPCGILLSQCLSILFNIFGVPSAPLCHVLSAVSLGVRDLFGAMCHVPRFSIACFVSWVCETPRPFDRVNFVGMCRSVYLAQRANLSSMGGVVRLAETWIRSLPCRILRTVLLWIGSTALSLCGQMANKQETSVSDVVRRLILKQA